MLLRLRLNCANMAAPLHQQGRHPSPTRDDCPEPETLEHLLCSCPQHAAQRAALQAALQHLGLRSQNLQDLLFLTGPTGIRRVAFSRRLLGYLEATRLTQRL